MNKLLLLLPLFALSSGCVAVAAGAAGAGYLAYREGENAPVEEFVDHDQEVVAEATIETLEILHDVGEPVTTGDGSTTVREATSSQRARVFRTIVDATELEVHVEAYDLGRTLVRVLARMRLTGDQEETARRVLDDIVRRSDELAR